MCLGWTRTSGADEGSIFASAVAEADAVSASLVAVSGVFFTEGEGFGEAVFGDDDG